MHCFGNALFKEICIATNFHIIENVPEYNKSTITDLVSIDCLLKYFGLLLAISMFKPPRIDMQTFIQNITEIMGSFSKTGKYALKNVKKMSFKRFNFIAAHLDVGKNQKCEKKVKGKVKKNWTANQ